jgi:hypothetical protein
VPASGPKLKITEMDNELKRNCALWAAGVTRGLDKQIVRRMDGSPRGIQSSHFDIDGRAQFRLVEEQADNKYEIRSRVRQGGNGEDVDPDSSRPDPAVIVRRCVVPDEE